MKSNLLIIDDDQSLLKILTTLLEKKGYEVDIALNGFEGLELLKIKNFDLVISDINMPETDGLKLIRQIKNISPKTDVIVVTAYANLENAIEAFKEDGAFSFFPKPIDFQDFLKSVEKAIDKRRNLNELQTYIESLNKSLELMAFAGLILLNDKKEVVYWNQWVNEKLDIPLRDAKGNELDSIFPQLKDSRIMRAVNNCITSNMTKQISNRLIGVPFPFYQKELPSDKKKFIQQVILVKPVNLSSGCRYCLVNITDVSRTQSSESTLKQTSDNLHKVKKQEEYIRAVFENTTDAIITFRENGIIEDVNSPSELVFKTNKSTLTGYHISHLIKEFNQTESIRPQLEALQVTDESTKELTGIRMNSSFPIEFSLGVMWELSTYVAIVRDITERKKAENQLVKLAQFDSLTGLCNRAMFHQKLDDALKRSKRNNQRLAIMFMDLDRFKMINDTLGHDVGDELLVHVSKVLKSILRDSDTVSRIGGDEFTIIMDNLVSVDHVAIVAQKIISNISKEVVLKGNSLAISTSIGIAVYPHDGLDSNTLVKNADTAMYSAKEGGRNTYTYFSNEMNKKANRRLELETKLRRAIEKEELTLFFQPQISIIEKKVIGYEALVRWQQSEVMISPYEFIPIAEETDLILPLGDWVIKNALYHLDKLKKDQFPDYKMSINVSPRQFRSKFLLDVIKKNTENYNIDPSKVVVEITESHLLNETELICQILNDLKSIGVRIALDDFGTGYSSLSYLRTIPIDILKIDRSFIVDIEECNVARNILKTIIEMAQVLKMDVVAEGVETRYQLEMLNAMGCHIIQGYYYSKPLSYDELLTYMNNNTPYLRKKY